MDTPNEKFSAQWALDLLEPTEIDYTGSWLKNCLVPAFTVWGYGSLRLRNYYTARPPHHNPPLIIAATIGCTILGLLVQEFGRVINARKDSALREYVMLHPDRFPEPRNKQYKDLFLDWYPVR